IATCGNLRIRRTRDFNGADFEGAGLWQLTVRNGIRVSAASAYLRPALRRHNLDVQTHAHATRVLFEGRRASGVEFLRAGIRHRVTARSEVILSAGAVNSPQLLELSGIGDPQLLRSLDLPVLSSAPAVGQGL